MRLPEDCMVMTKIKQNQRETRNELDYTVIMAMQRG